MDNSNAAIVVTGACGGMGKEVTATLVARGYRVIAVDLTGGGPPMAGVDRFALDVTDEQAVEEFSASMKPLGVAGLVNAAGVNVRADALCCSAEVFMLNVRVNLLGTFLMAREVARHLIEAGGGSIVNVASIVSFVGTRRSQAAYTATKGGIAALTRALAVEWAPMGVRVNAIAPAFIDTPMNAEISSDPEAMSRVLSAIPLGRLGTPADNANAIAWLLSEESSFVTGEILRVDGGYLSL